MASIPLFQTTPSALPAPAPVAAPEREDLARLRAALGEHSRQLRSGREVLRDAGRQVRSAVATGLRPLDRLLGGGFPKGRLIELTGTRSSGRYSIVLSSLASITRCGEPAALVDHGAHFDPQVAKEAGIDLERLLWVAPSSVKGSVAAAEMLLATGFPLVIIDLGMRLRGRRVPDAAWIRLARAAQAYGAALLLSAPFSLTPMAAAGIIRAERARPRWNHAGPPLLDGLSLSMVIEKWRHDREGKRTETPLRISSS
ncbi:MAG TPA: hypothetical protein VM557_06340 [Thermoanaerobaculia bacterium]|nr:hypothetical protein [Thermoanaerobaculia bacterium]